MAGSIESLPAQQPTNIRYWVLSGFCAAAAIAYIQRYSINLFAPSIQDDLSLDKDQMGSVMSGFFAGYALMQIPAAWLGDRWGSRHALTLYAVTWSLATALMAVALNLDSLVAIWTLMGMAQAGLFPCAIIGLRDWLPITLRAVASGMLSTFMNVGAVLAPLLAGWLLLRYTWREAFVWLSVPGIVWAAWYLLVVSQSAGRAFGSQRCRTAAHFARHRAHIVSRDSDQAAHAVAALAVQLSHVDDRCTAILSCGGAGLFRHVVWHISHREPRHRRERRSAVGRHPADVAHRRFDCWRRFCPTGCCVARAAAASLAKAWPLSIWRFVPRCSWRRRCSKARIYASA